MGAGGAGPSAAPTRQSRFLRLAGRASWNLIDQVLTAVTNAVLFFVLARTVSTGELDAFANAFYVFTMVIGVERALVGQVLGIRFSGSHGAAWRQVLGQAFGFILTVTAVIGVALAAIGLALGGVHGRALLATALVLPGLILQDAGRMAFFAQSRARDAAVNDALWAVLQFTGVVLLIRAEHSQVPYLILAWGGAATVCALVAMVRLGAVPDLRGTRAWLGRTWDVSRFLLGENMLTVGAFNGGFLLVGVLAGEGAVSAIRGAQVLLGPLQTVSSAMFTFTLPELSRRAWLTAAVRWKVAMTASAVMLATALAYAGALLLLPDSAGTFLFGDNWSGSRDILLPVALGHASAVTCLGPAVSIYALGLARKTFRLMTLEAPLVLTLMLGGAVLFGVQGAAWGLAANHTLLIPLWFLQLRAILDRPLPTEHPSTVTPGADPVDEHVQRLPTPPLDGEPTGAITLPGDPLSPSGGIPRAASDQ